MFRLFSTKIPLFVATLALAVAVTGCAQTIQMDRTKIVPAAAGAVKVTQDDNKNAMVAMEIQRLAPPENLTPPKKTYMIWARSSSEQLFPLGQLKVDDEGAGKFSGSVPSDNFRVLITAEESTAASSPSEQVVLSTSFFSVD